MKETEDYIIIELTNDTGKKYEVGYPKSAGYTKENLMSELAETDSEVTRAKDGYKNINYKPDGDSFTSQEAISIGICGGYVWSEKGWVYDYQLVFANHKNAKYLFKDESGDQYSCRTYRTGLHTINYNSGKPTMIGVK